ncbi:MAG: ATP-dependent sacrificial sulfur transferase LarE [bacterium]
MTQNKIRKIKTILRRYPGAVVAFSGGVDSTLLLKLTIDVLKDNVVAVTAASPIHPKKEIINAKKLAKSFGCKHICIRTCELTNPRFVSNTKNHCYFCKLQLFKHIKSIAAKYGFTVIEGSNKSDLSDHRPGLKALKKLKILSPFIEVGFTKQEIRSTARKLHLPNWEKPSMACLASRIPYGKRIDKQILERIDRAENYLNRLNLSQIRVREHFPLARIEVYPTEFNVILDNRQRIIKHFKRLGYKFMVLDLAGYQTGSFNK